MWSWLYDRAVGLLAWIAHQRGYRGILVVPTTDFDQQIMGTYRHISARAPLYQAKKPSQFRPTPSG